MSEYIFSCETDSPKPVFHALFAIKWKSSDPQPCSASVSSKGILFLTEDISVLQANVFLKNSLFPRFYYNENNDSGESFEFRVNLTSLVDCLKVFAETASHLKICIMKDAATDLKISIEDGNSITDCTLRTLHCSPDQSDIDKAYTLTNAADAAQFSIGSKIAREMFRYPNDSKNKSIGIAMTIDPIEKTFEVRAEGAFGAETSIMSLTTMTQKVIIRIEERMTTNFPVSSLTPVLDAMDLSIESKFIFKENGVLTVQQGVKGDGGIDTIVEFILQPLEDNPF